MNDTLYIVVPCYKEEEVLPISSKALLEVLTDMITNGQISNESRILFVNDGSSDQTWPIISQLTDSDPHFCGVNLSRNCGHQNALLAGLEVATSKGCDMAVTIDADLQDDIHIIPQMVTEYQNGNEVVYAVRNSRDTDSAFKRLTAHGFYRVMSLLGVELIYDHADYRLLSHRAALALLSFQDRNLFIRGLVPKIGFQHTNVYYKREKRAAGESKYPLKKMLAFALDGITSCSVRPIRMISCAGFLFCLLSILMIIYTVIGKLTGQTVSGWASLLSLMMFFSGFQTLALGIVGEYIGKVYTEVKQHPRYFISDIKTNESDPN